MMIGLNEELKERAKLNLPVKVGIIGCGQMGTDVVAEISRMKGIQVISTSDINIERAIKAYQIGGVNGEAVTVHTVEEANQAVTAGKYVVTQDYRIVTDMDKVDVVLEATGVPEIGAKAALRVIKKGHDLAMMNVETDITVGPILNWYAQQKGVLYALAAGDEPAACKELFDFADALGFTVVAAGKGKNNPLDRYLTPDEPDVIMEAKRRGLNPNMLIEFIDGSKTMIEMAAVSNSCGLVPDIRGMHGPETDRDHLHHTFALRKDGGILNKMGVVDYGVGKVAPGVFLVVYTDHPRLQEAMSLRDMGKGPYYTLFRPYHLCSIEVPLTCAMLSIQRRSNMHPMSRLVSEVFAVAKRDLLAGDVLDGIGGSTYYSLIDTYEKARDEGLLPIGLAKGAVIQKPISKDAPIKYSDVQLKPSAILQLRQLQDKWFNGEIQEGELLEQLDHMQ